MIASPACAVAAPAPRRPLKRDRILEAFIYGNRLTRFDAEQLGDHCLPTTVSDLQKLGAVIKRQPIEREGRFGRFHCNVYWIDASDREQARRILLGDVT